MTTPKLQSLNSYLDESSEFRKEEEEEDVQNVLNGLLEPTTEIIEAVAQCHGKFGGIRINLGGLNLNFIPFEVKSLTDLRICNLRNNSLTMFPSEVRLVLRCSLCCHRRRVVSLALTHSLSPLDSSA